MANAFNLTAQINLRGPSNIGAIVGDIKKQLGSINANVNLNVSANAAKNITQLNSALQTLNQNLANTSTQASKAASAIAQFNAAVGNINIKAYQNNISSATSATQQMVNSQGAAKTSIKAVSSEMEEFGKQAGLAVRRFAAFSVASSAIFGLINSMSKGVSAFVSFDKEFVKLQQVTDESATGLNSLQKTITSLSTSLGVGSADLLTVSSTLAQAGLSARDTEKALKALALSALAPSFDSMNDTVEGSIALMRQFGIGAGDLTKALGSVNAVAAKFAVEASDIIAAIQRTGGVFASASKGVSEGTDALNEFIAVFTSVRATTRESAETIATGLRTIFTRVQREGTIEALKEYGVNLTDLNGKFVGAYKAVELLSQGLGNLDPRDLRFSRIVEELGGFRQIGKVIPLIQQFGTAQQALAVAQGGQDSLTKDSITAQLSLANQISKVREEFLALFRAIGSSDTFQYLTRGILQITSALIRVADVAKGVLPVLAVIGISKGLDALTKFGYGFATGIKKTPEKPGTMREGGIVHRFATGGLVPGTGDNDSVSAMLTPGEFVMRKTAVNSIGRTNLQKMNDGGPVNIETLSRRRDSGAKIRSFQKISNNYIENNDKVHANIKRKTLEDMGFEDKDYPIIKQRLVDEGVVFPIGSKDGSSRGKFDARSGSIVEEMLVQRMGKNAKKYPGVSGHSDVSNAPIDIIENDNIYEVKFKSKSTSDNEILGKFLRYRLENTDTLVDKKRPFASIGFEENTPQKTDDVNLGSINLIHGADLKDVSGYKTDFINWLKNQGLYKLSLGGKIQKFPEGGIAQRRVGYIDYDVIANEANKAIVEKGMESTGQKGPRLYTDYLTQLAVKARKQKDVTKLRAVYGVAGSGKTTLARGQGTDDATLRKTERFPILGPEDVQRATEVIVLSSSVSKDKLDNLFSATDRTYTLSSTTEKEQEIIESNRESRDVTGIGLENRKPGSTRSVAKDSAVGEALLADRLGNKSVVLGRTETGRLRRKSGNELVEIVKKKIGFTWGGFAPMTAGHESIMDAAAAMGIPPEDFIYLVGANEGVDAKSYRTAVFDQDARVLLAKAGAGARGATVLPKPRDFEVPQAFDISPETGRRKVLVPGKGSTAFVADKSPEELKKYKDAGYGAKNLERTGGISGTMVRDLIASGDLGKLQSVLSPGVYELISNNIGRIQNRANILPSIIAEVEQTQGVKLADVEKEIKALGISRIESKKVASDPEYAAKVEVLKELRAKRDKIKSAGSFEPYRLLAALAAKEPNKYGLDFSTPAATDIKPVRTVSRKIQKASLGGIIQRFMAGGEAKPQKQISSSSPTPVLSAILAKIEQNPQSKEYAFKSYQQELAAVLNQAYKGNLGPGLAPVKDKVSKDTVLSMYDEHTGSGGYIRTTIGALEDDLKYITGGDTERGALKKRKGVEVGDMLDTIRAYQALGLDYTLNAALATGRTNETLGEFQGEDLSESYKIAGVDKLKLSELVKRMDAAAQFKFPEKLYSGLGDSKLDLILNQTGTKEKKDIDDLVGKTFNMSSFLSSSDNEALATSFARVGMLTILTNPKRKGIIPAESKDTTINRESLEDRAKSSRVLQAVIGKKGMLGLDIDEDYADAYDSEGEYIFPSNSKFKINSINKQTVKLFDKDAGYRHLDMEVQQLRKGGTVKRFMAGGVAEDADPMTDAIAATKGRAEILDLLSGREGGLQTTAKEVGVGIEEMRRALGVKAPDAKTKALQEAIRHEYVKTYNRQAGAARATTTKLEDKGLVFAAAGIFGKPFPPKNIDIVSDRLKKSAKVRVISGVMDKAKADQIDQLFTQGSEDIAEKAALIVSGGTSLTGKTISNPNAEGSIQGGLIEKMVQRLGGPGKTPGQGFDFPNGLQGAAKHFHVDPDLPTDVKRTLEGPSTFTDNIITYLKNVRGYAIGGMVQKFVDGGWVKRMQAQKKAILQEDLLALQSALVFSGDTGAYVPTYDKKGVKEKVDPAELLERYKAMSDFLNQGKGKGKTLPLKDAQGYNRDELLDAVAYYQGGSGPLARAMVNQDFIFTDRDESYETEDVANRLKAASQYKPPKKLFSGLGRGQFNEILSDAQITPDKFIKEGEKSISDLVGKTIDFPTFLSTSTDKEMAKVFVGSPGAFMSIDSGKSKQLGIDILKAKGTKPSGAPAARRLPGIEKIDPVKLIRYDQEKEFVLQPSTQFKILAARDASIKLEDEELSQEEYYASMLETTPSQKKKNKKQKQETDPAKLLKGIKLDIEAQMLARGGMAKQLEKFAGGGIGGMFKSFTGSLKSAYDMLFGEEKNQYASGITKKATLGPPAPPPPPPPSKQYASGITKKATLGPPAPPPPAPPQKVGSNKKPILGPAAPPPPAPPQKNDVTIRNGIAVARVPSAAFGPKAPPPPPPPPRKDRDDSFALGGNVLKFDDGGYVPAMVSNGEAFVPPETARSIGYGKLAAMNQADRNGMRSFASGGISVFKGPGHGTSDSIGPIALPVGSFIIREAATKALGLHTGGVVGIQKFASGSPGGVGVSTIQIIEKKAQVQAKKENLEDLQEKRDKASGAARILLDSQIKDVQDTLKKLDDEIKSATDEFTSLSTTIDKASKAQKTAESNLSTVQADLVKKMQTAGAVFSGGREFKDLNEDEKQQAITDARAGNIKDASGEDLFKVQNEDIAEAESRVNYATSIKEQREEERKTKFGSAKSAEDVKKATLTTTDQKNQKARDEAFFEYQGKKEGTTAASYRFGLARDLGKAQYQVKEQYAGNVQSMSYGLVGKQESLSSIGSTIQAAQEKAKTAATPAEADAAATQLADAQSRLAIEAENIAKSMKDLNPTLDMNEVQTAAKEIAEALSNGRLEEAQEKLVKTLGDVGDDSEKSLQIAMQQIAKQRGVDIGILQREFEGGGKGAKALEQQQFINSREGQRFGVMAEIAPGLAESFSKTRVGQIGGNVSDFLTGKGGRYSQLLGKFGGTTALAAGISTLPGIATQVLGKSTTSGGAAAEAGIQGAASTVGAGLQLASTSGPLAPFVLAGTAVAALAVAAKDARNGFIEFEKNLRSQNIQRNLESANTDIATMNREVSAGIVPKDMTVQNRAAATLARAGGEAAALNNVEQNIPKAFFANLFDLKTDKPAADRAQILEKFGTMAYAQSYFSDDTRRRYKEDLIPEQSQQAAKNYSQVAASSRQFIETKLAGGSSLADVKKMPEFDQLARNIALADSALQEQIMAIDNSTDYRTEADRTAAKEALIRAKADKEVAQVANASERARAAAELEKTSRSFSMSFKRLFENMEASIGRSNFELAKFNTSLDASTAAMSGQGKNTKTEFQALNVLKNPKAYSRDEVDKANKQAGSLFGMDAQIVGGLAGLGEKLETSLLTSINSTLRNNKGASDTKVAIDMEKAVGKELEGLNLPKDLSSQLNKEITQAVGKIRSEKGTDKVDIEELMGRVSGLKDVFESAKNAQTAVISALENYQNALNQYSEAMNKAADLEYEASERRRRSNDLVIEGSINLGRALGKEFLPSIGASTRDKKVSAMTGGLTNPVDIRNRMNDLEDQRQRQQADVDFSKNQSVGRGPGAINDVIANEKALKQTNNQLRSTQQALKHLAESGDAASTALNSVQDAQRKQQGKVGLIEKLVTSGPAELDSFNRSFNSLQQMSMGQVVAQTPEQRKDTLSVLNDITPLLGNSQEANNLKASALESMLKDSGIGVTSQFQDILNAMRNPETDTETQRAIKVYEEAIGVQRSANAELAGINGRLADDIANKTGKAVADALTNVTLKFDKAQMDDIAKGVRDRSTTVEAVPKALGGLIYAAAGTMIDFQPRGTDTVPAMLTPGEFVVNSAATSRNLGVLQDINSGRTNYYAKGGYVSNLSPGTTRSLGAGGADIEATKNEYPDISDIGIGGPTKDIHAFRNLQSLPMYNKTIRLGEVSNGRWLGYEPGLSADFGAPAGHMLGWNYPYAMRFEVGTIGAGAGGTSRTVQSISSSPPSIPGSINLGRYLNMDLINRDKINKKNQVRSEDFERYKEKLLSVKDLVPETLEINKQKSFKINDQEILFDSPNNIAAAYKDYAKIQVLDAGQFLITNMSSNMGGPVGPFFNSLTGNKNNDITDYIFSGTLWQEIIAKRSEPNRKSSVIRAMGGSKPEALVDPDQATKEDKYLTDLQTVSKTIKTAIEQIQTDSATYDTIETSNFKAFSQKLGQIYTGSVVSDVFTQNDNKFMKIPDFAPSDTLTVYSTPIDKWKNEYVQIIENKAIRENIKNLEYYGKVGGGAKDPVTITPEDGGIKKEFGWIAGGKFSFDDSIQKVMQADVDENVAKAKGTTTTIPDKTKKLPPITSANLELPYDVSYTKIKNPTYDPSKDPIDKEYIYTINNSDAKFNIFKHLTDKIALDQTEFERNPIDQITSIASQLKDYEIINTYLDTPKTDEAAIKDIERQLSTKLVKVTGNVLTNDMTSYLTRSQPGGGLTSVATNSISVGEYLIEAVKKLKENRSNKSKEKFGKENEISFKEKQYPGASLALILGAQELFGPGGVYEIPQLLGPGWFTPRLGSEFKSIYDVDNSLIRSYMAGLASIFNNKRSVINGAMRRSPNVQIYDLLVQSQNYMDGAFKAFEAIGKGDTGSIAGFFGDKAFNTPTPNGDPAMNRKAIELFQMIGSAKQIESAGDKQLTMDQKKERLEKLKGVQQNKPGSADTETAEITDVSDIPDTYQGLFYLAVNPYNRFPKRSVREDLLNESINAVPTAKLDNNLPLFTPTTGPLWQKALGDLKFWYTGDKKDWLGVDYLFEDGIVDPASKQPVSYSTRLKELEDNKNDALYDDAKKGFAFIGGKEKFSSDLPDLEYYKKNVEPPQYKQTGGLIYASAGTLVNFEPRGTDTVPAMLTPGEFVINARATAQHLPLLKAINSGSVTSADMMMSKGGVVYLAEGTDDPVEQPPKPEVPPEVQAQKDLLREQKKAENDQIKKLGADRRKAIMEQRQQQGKAIKDARSQVAAQLKEAKKEYARQRQAGAQGQKAYNSYRIKLLKQGIPVAQANAMASQHAQKEYQFAYSDIKEEEKLADFRKTAKKYGTEDGSEPDLTSAYDPNDDGLITGKERQQGNEKRDMLANKDLLGPMLSLPKSVRTALRRIPEGPDREAAIAKVMPSDQYRVRQIALKKIDDDKFRALTAKDPSTLSKEEAQFVAKRKNSDTVAGIVGSVAQQAVGSVMSTVTSLFGSTARKDAKDKTATADASTKPDRTEDYSRTTEPGKLEEPGSATSPSAPSPAKDAAKDDREAAEAASPPAKSEDVKPDAYDEMVKSGAIDPTQYSKEEYKADLAKRFARAKEIETKKKDRENNLRAALKQIGVSDEQETDFTTGRYGKDPETGEFKELYKKSSEIDRTVGIMFGKGGLTDQQIIEFHQNKLAEKYTSENKGLEAEISDLRRQESKGFLGFGGVDNSAKIKELEKKIYENTLRVDAAKERYTPQSEEDKQREPELRKELATARENDKGDTRTWSERNLGLNLGVGYQVAGEQIAGGLASAEMAGDKLHGFIKQFDPYGSVVSPDYKVDPNRQAVNKMLADRNNALLNETYGSTIQSVSDTAGKVAQVAGRELKAVSSIPSVINQNIEEALGMEPTDYLRRPLSEKALAERAEAREALDASYVYTSARRSAGQAKNTLQSIGPGIAAGLGTLKDEAAGIASVPSVLDQYIKKTLGIKDDKDRLGRKLSPKAQARLDAEKKASRDAFDKAFGESGTIGYSNPIFGGAADAVGGVSNAAVGTTRMVGGGLGFGVGTLLHLGKSSLDSRGAFSDVELPEQPTGSYDTFVNTLLKASANEMGRGSLQLTGAGLPMAARVSGSQMYKDATKDNQAAYNATSDYKFQQADEQGVGTAVRALDTASAIAADFALGADVFAGQAYSGVRGVLGATKGAGTTVLKGAQNTGAAALRGAQTKGAQLVEMASDAASSGYGKVKQTAKSVIKEFRDELNVPKGYSLRADLRDNLVKPVKEGFGEVFDGLGDFFIPGRAKAKAALQEAELRGAGNAPLPDWLTQGVSDLASGFDNLPPMPVSSPQKPSMFSKFFGSKKPVSTPDDLPDSATLIQDILDGKASIYDNLVGTTDAQNVSSFARSVGQSFGANVPFLKKGFDLYDAGKGVLNTTRDRVKSFFKPTTKTTSSSAAIPSKGGAISTAQPTQLVPLSPDQTQMVSLQRQIDTIRNSQPTSILESILGRKPLSKDLQTQIDELENQLSTLSRANPGFSPATAMAQGYSSGGIVYASNGAFIAAQARGTDTVPAMLTPGEFVVNREAAQRYMPTLNAINSGNFANGGYVQYLANGGAVRPKYLEGGSYEPVNAASSQTGVLNSAAAKPVVVDKPAWVDELISGINQGGAPLVQAASAIAQGANTMAAAGQDIKSAQPQLTLGGSVDIANANDIIRKSLDGMMPIAASAGQAGGASARSAINSDLAKQTDFALGGQA